MTTTNGIAAQSELSAAGVPTRDVRTETSLPSVQLVKNHILRSLASVEFEHIRRFLKPVLLKERSILQEPNRPIEYIHFVESGIISQMALARESSLEVAMVGSRGFAPVSIVLGQRTSPYRSMVLSPGISLRISADDLLCAMCDRPQIREHLIRCVQPLMVHGAQTAICGTRHQLEQRLASWLCLATDTLGRESIEITHRHLCTILGLRRPGITRALNHFEHHGLVRNQRGIVHIHDRERLESKACCCYQAITAAYR
jgi:CRP-like cAMP-binding protein